MTKGAAVSPLGIIGPVDQENGEATAGQPPLLAFPVFQ